MSDTVDEQLPEDEQEYNAHDAAAVAKAQRKEKRLRKKKLRVVEVIMSNEDGRAWMYDFLGINCHIFSDNPMNSTPERNGRYEGERAVGLRVLDEVMSAAPEMFWEMRREALDREKK